MRSFLKLLVISSVALVLFSGCAPSMKMGSQEAKTTATGSAGGANAANANKGLERCQASLGTLAIYEDKSDTWYQHLTQDLRLPSTIPVLRLLAQQSNCFVIVERGKAFKQMQQERALMQSGELRGNSNFGKGQIVAADYTMTPSITFSSGNTGGMGAVAGALFGRAAGVIAGGFRHSDASTMLTLIENRSGVQLAAAEGSARNTDFALLGGLGFGAGAGGAGAYSKTPQGKVIIGAFTDSMNNLIKSVKAYKAQTVKGGLGAGGNMQVQGSVNTGLVQSYEGVITKRVFDPKTALWSYQIILKDKSNAYAFSSKKKIMYKNDLVKFSILNGEVDVNSIKLIEARYYQKYWQ